jgi:hypothetical protein
MFPHMHVRGKSFRYEVAYPDGKTEVLLNVPKFDFMWQHRYILAEPKLLPAGSRLRGVASYDNSPANLNNPDPTTTVRCGPQTTDEMFNGYYDFYEAAPSGDVSRGTRVADLAIVGAGLVAIFALGRRMLAPPATPRNERARRAQKCTCDNAVDAERSR